MFLYFIVRDARTIWVYLRSNSGLVLQDCLVAWKQVPGYTVELAIVNDTTLIVHCQWSVV